MSGSTSVARMIRQGEEAISQATSTSQTAANRTAIWVPGGVLSLKIGYVSDLFALSKTPSIGDDSPELQGNSSALLEELT